MKERKFWRIYFILVNTYVAPYEKQYMDELKMKSEQKKDDGVKETLTSAQATKTAEKDTKLQSKASTSSNAEHDLDIFLLGDLGSDDEGPDVHDDAEDNFDDDFDKIDSTSGLESDEENKKHKDSK
ncbi:hypothetical protein ACMD2_11566 [Ananas comosus]|nr:hypothetical protein ACMD2_11566 [Ananas comosus]